MGGTELDIVLNEYHNNNQSLPDIEHYFILLYYNIKQSSITQLQQLWQKLYNLFKIKMKQNVVLPTIYINFENGEQPTNINNVFNMLYHPEFGIDLQTLKDAVIDYYYQWHPKCISAPNGIFSNLTLDDITMERPDEHHRISGYNADGFWSMADGLKFPSFPSLPSPQINDAEITPNGQTPDGK